MLLPLTQHLGCVLNICNKPIPITLTIKQLSGFKVSNITE